jgi:DNA-binding CsgD family transcriptional regulator
MAGGHDYRWSVDVGQRRRYETAFSAITRVCSKAEPGDDLFGQVSAQLKSVVAFRTAGWLRVDPLTLLPLPGLLLQASHNYISHFIHNEYFEPDVAKFRDIAGQQVPVQTLWRATEGEPSRSPRYRSILRHIGYGDDLRMVLRSGGSSWGVACLARAESDPPFNADDIAFVARVCEPLAEGLRFSFLLAGDAPAGPGPSGVLILSDDNEVMSLTGDAERWLEVLPADRAGGLHLPASVLSVASQARALARPQSVREVPTARIRTTAGGWLRLHAASLTSSSAGTGQIAVILEPAQPADLSALIFDRYGLTGRERQITNLLLRGLSTREITQALFISRHTLSDHMKAIFAKLGVSSRPELTALFLDYRPVVASASHGHP